MQHKMFKRFDEKQHDSTCQKPTKKTYIGPFAETKSGELIKLWIVDTLQKLLRLFQPQLLMVFFLSGWNVERLKSLIFLKHPKCAGASNGKQLLSP